MTLEQADAWLKTLVDDFLTFNDDVEWREGAAAALLDLLKHNSITSDPGAGPRP